MRLPTEYLNKDGAFSSILMFVSADSADTGKSRLWKHSGGPGQWARILHYSVIPLKLRNEKAKLGMLAFPSKLLISADNQLIACMWRERRIKPGWTLRGRANLMAIYCHIVAFFFNVTLTLEMFKQFVYEFSTEALCKTWVRTNLDVIAYKMWEKSFKDAQGKIVKRIQRWFVRVKTCRCW